MYRSFFSLQTEPLTELYSVLPEVSVPRTPSSFAVFAAVRATCLESKQRQAALLQLQNAAAWKEMEDGGIASAGGGEDGSSGDVTGAEDKKRPLLPKIVGIGLQGVLEIIRESHFAYPSVCVRALRSLLDILQGLQPEELSKEPAVVTEAMFKTLMELAALPDQAGSPSSDKGDHIRALSCSCLLSLAVALGDTGKLLRATSSMLMSPKGSERVIMPAILTSLQRSVASVMLAKTEHPDLMGRGVESLSKMDSFGVSFRGGGALPGKVHGLASDGTFVYVLSESGLYKVGSGYGSTVKGRVYRHRADFDPSPAWIGCAGGNLYYTSLDDDEEELGARAIKKLEICQIDKEELVISNVSSIRDEKVLVSSSPRVMLTDGTNLGVMITASSSGTPSTSASNNGGGGGEDFLVKFFGGGGSDNSVMTCVQELSLRLARKCVDAYGASIAQEAWEAVAKPDVDGQLEAAGAVRQLEFGTDDNVLAVQSGRDFALMLTSQGRLYHSGIEAKYLMEI